MKKISTILLLWLLVVNIFGWLVVNRFNLKPDTAYTWIEQSDDSRIKNTNLVNLHAQWDSFWYQDIATNGYHLNESNTLSNIVFFPVYPALIYLFSAVLGLEVVLAGWVISIASLIGAVFVFYKLVKEFHPELDPETPIFYLLIFPTAFFLNAVYTESLFLMLSLLTFYYAFKGKFWQAGAFGLLASLTRVTGVLLFLPVAYEYFRQTPYKEWIKIKALSLLLIPLGTFVFFGYHYVKFGDFFLFLKVESAWGRAFVFNKEHFSALTNSARANLIIDFGFGVFAAAMSIIVFKKRWIAYGLYVIATIVVAISSGSLMSIGRYILVLFPIYIMLANISLKNKQFEKLYTLVSILLFGLNITLFVNGYWAG